VDPNYGSFDYLQVVLSIGDTVWALPLVEHARNAHGGMYQVFNVRQEIIKNILSGLDNPEHLSNLYKLCEETGFDCSIYDPVVVLGEGTEDKLHFC